MPSKSLKDLQVEERRGYLWITLPDAINMDNHRTVEKKLEETIAGSEKKIVIDLGETRNMYSAGYGLIVRLKKMFDTQRRDMYIVNVSERTMEGIHAVGIDKLIPVYGERTKPEFLQE